MEGYVVGHVIQIHMIASVQMMAQAAFRVRCFLVSDSTIAVT